MLLPEHCSIKVDGQGCQLPPSYVVSVSAHDGEYMLAVVCDDHRVAMEERLLEMQKSNRIPQGRIVFQQVKMVTTDCVTGMNEDYADIELKRGVESDRKI